jgi:hypothetical protein
MPVDLQRKTGEKSWQPDGSLTEEEKGMEQTEKLSVIIEHWIEHNESHMDEYRRWAQRAGEMGLDQAKAEIEEAIGLLSQSNRHLEKARKAVKPVYA